MKINDIKYILIQTVELENYLPSLISIVHADAQGSVLIEYVRHVAKEAKYALEQIEKEENDNKRDARRH